MLMSFIKYFFLFAILLFLFHFESISVGSFKISHLWKGAVLVFLIINLLRRKANMFFIYKPLLALSLLQLINLELIINPINAFLSFSILIIIPLIGLYIMQFSEEQLKRGLLFLSSFFILCFLPYELGLLNSLGETYDLQKYGLKSSGLIGPFQGAHAASISLAGSFLVILYFWFTKSFSRLILTFLLILNFYFLINTYVRTGMVMVIIGALPILFYFGKNESSSRIRLIMLTGFIAVVTSFWVLDNDALLNRIRGEDKYSKEDSFEEIGSGRGLIYLTNIEVFRENNFFEKIIGIGQTELINRTEKKIGFGVLSHNGFLQVLLSNGIIGLIFLLTFLRSIYKLKNRVYPKYFPLILSLLLGLIVMSFLQNYDILYFHLLLMLVITFFVKKSFMKSSQILD